MSSDCEQNSFDCARCPCSFASKQKRFSHLISFHDDDSFRVYCTRCGVSFPTKRQLAIHWTPSQLRPFKCRLCTASFSRKPDIVRHMRSHANAKSYPHKCSHCAASFRIPVALSNHITVHHSHNDLSAIISRCVAADAPSNVGTSRFRCCRCEKSTLRKADLTSHLTRAHSDARPCQCKLCPSAFKTAASLLHHERRVHTIQKAFRCKDCAASFAEHYHLRIHENKHRNVGRSFDCPQCGEECKTAGSLSRHLAIHNRRGQKVLRCQRCEKAFGSLLGFREHQEVHDAESSGSKARIKCPQCPATFKIKNSLTGHLRRMHGSSKRHGTFRSSKPAFGCGLCLTTHKTKDLLLYHLAYAHASLQVGVNCLHCPATFIAEEELLSHVLRVHPDKATRRCPHCSASFTYTCALKHHILRCHDMSVGRPFKCAKCSKAFKFAFALKQHQFVHSADRLTCAHCLVSFKQGKYLKTHIEAKHAIQRKPFGCEQCPAGFKRMANLRHHVEAVHKGAQLSKTLKCAHCLMTFKFRRDLREHLDRHLDGRMRCLRCDKCSRTFCNRQSLHSHHSACGVIAKRGTRFRVKQNSSIVCARCSCSFKEKRSLWKHVQCIHYTDNLTP